MRQYVCDCRCVHVDYTHRHTFKSTIWLEYTLYIHRNHYMDSCDCLFLPLTWTPLLSFFSPLSPSLLSSFLSLSPFPSLFLVPPLPPSHPPQVANHRVNTFSGGMKRRLSVALSFLGDPEIMFLGERWMGTGGMREWENGNGRTMGRRREESEWN